MEEDKEEQNQWKEKKARKKVRSKLYDPMHLESIDIRGGQDDRKVRRIRIRERRKGSEQDLYNHHH
jgi:hypothetical protein